ncbi:hypothetical protein KC19_11G042900 [Ceratodon purpureus]|uniref:Uncharacterized protein n=1 Tax=Ceratodon purpureus TaxID=3225 RepID=A0A8T0GB71_CERPU|nr:hypothetical protein KC19_11G042900 [Ceratodon purpureus]
MSTTLDLHSNSTQLRTCKYWEEIGFVLKMRATHPTRTILPAVGVPSHMRLQIHTSLSSFSFFLLLRYMLFFYCANETTRTTQRSILIYRGLNRAGRAFIKVNHAHSSLL